MELLVLFATPLMGYVHVKEGTLTRDAINVLVVDLTIQPVHVRILSLDVLICMFKYKVVCSGVDCMVGRVFTTFGYGATW